MRAFLSRSARWVAMWCLVTGWAVPARAQSPASQYVGRPVESIQLLVEDRVTTDASRPRSDPRSDPSADR